MPREESGDGGRSRASLGEWKSGLKLLNLECILFYLGSDTEYHGKARRINFALFLLVLSFILEFTLASWATAN